METYQAQLRTAEEDQMINDVQAYANGFVQELELAGVQPYRGTEGDVEIAGFNFRGLHGPDDSRRYGLIFRISENNVTSLSISSGFDLEFGETMAPEYVPCYLYSYEFVAGDLHTTLIDHRYTSEGFGEKTITRINDDTDLVEIEDLLNAASLAIRETAHAKAGNKNTYLSEQQKIANRRIAALEGLISDAESSAAPHAAAFLSRALNLIEVDYANGTHIPSFTNQ